MNEDEVASLLNALEQGLIQLGLSSLVNQERISAVEGKVEEVTPDDVAELRREWSLHSSGRPPGARDGDVRIRPLEAGERLGILLDLVEVAVGGTYAIEIHLRDDIKKPLMRVRIGTVKSSLQILPNPSQPQLCDLNGSCQIRRRCINVRPQCGT